LSGGRRAKEDREPEEGGNEGESGRVGGLETDRKRSWENEIDVERAEGLALAVASAAM
jgi:hypothetical protein